MPDSLSKVSSKKLSVSISHVANYLGVHPRTLRIWDKEGMLIPKRTKSNRRYYTLNDIEEKKSYTFSYK